MFSNVILPYYRLLEASLSLLFLLFFEIERMQLTYTVAASSEREGTRGGGEVHCIILCICHYCHNIVTIETNNVSALRATIKQE